MALGAPARRLTEESPALAAIWDGAPVMLDFVAPDEALVYCNRHEAESLGRQVEEIVGRQFGEIYSPPSARLLRRLLRRPEDRQVRSLRLKMKRADGSLVEMNALADCHWQGGEFLGLRVVKTPITEAQRHLEGVERDYEMLDSILSTAKDACWCIEFEEPVDLSISAEESIRQVFENLCFWRVLNPAMAALYRLPLGRDVRKENVRFIFPRNPENVDFVRRLVENDFNLDNAPSRDQRYDGTLIDAENDVRGYIRDNYLIRMWGTVRDVSQRNRRESELQRQIEGMKAILGALPDPVLVLDEGLRVVAANPALESELGWSLDEVLGHAVSEIVGPDKALHAVQSLLENIGNWQGAVMLRRASGDFAKGQGRAKRIEGHDDVGRIVLTLQFHLPAPRHQGGDEEEQAWEPRGG